MESFRKFRKLCIIQCLSNPIRQKERFHKIEWFNLKLIRRQDRLLIGGLAKRSNSTTLISVSSEGVQSRPFLWI